MLSIYIRGDNISNEDPHTFPKGWYIYAKLKPNLHLSMVTSDKTILLYAITQGIKFDVGHIIEKEIIESTQGHCTRALIHPSIITQLCRVAEVLMLESEEKSHHRLPLSLPKSKDGASDNMEDEDEEDPTVGQQSEEDSHEEDPEADLPDVLQSAFARLSTC